MAKSDVKLLRLGMALLAYNIGCAGYPLDNEGTEKIENKIKEMLLSGNFSKDVWQEFDRCLPDGSLKDWVNEQLERQSNEESDLVEGEFLSSEEKDRLRGLYADLETLIERYRECFADDPDSGKVVSIQEEIEKLLAENKDLAVGGWALVAGRAPFNSLLKKVADEAVEQQLDEVIENL